MEKLSLRPVKNNCFVPQVRFTRRWMLSVSMTSATVCLPRDTASKIIVLSPPGFDHHLYNSHAFMKTDPYCCTPGFTAENCDNAVCDTNGSCHHE